MISVTKGQWFPLTISNISYAGAAFDLQGATEVSASLVSTLGVKSLLNYEITAYNEISAVCDGSLSAGKYAIELTCKGSDGKAYRMKSPGAVIEVSSSTTSSTGSTSVRVAGDEWELTADVEMHEGQARTYMSLLEEARKGAVKAVSDAESVISSVESSVTKAQEASDAAKSASEAASKAVADTNKALENVTEMETTVNEAESKRAQSEQNRETAEAERVSAEKARAAAETERAASETGRANAETQRESDFSTAKTACEAAASNADTAADKANTATANANTAASNAKADYVGMDNYVYHWDSETGIYKKTNLNVKGDTGAQGPKGDKGDTGAQGPKGDKGDTGAPGDSTAANAAAEKANAAVEKVNAALESKVDYSKLLSDLWVGTAADYDAIATKQEGTIYLIDDTATAGTTTAGSGTVEKMWFGTRNDYDRMTTKDDNVLYMLVEEF